jgi:uncharacterized protein YjbI with pentapeptide repeats
MTQELQVDVLVVDPMPDLTAGSKQQNTHAQSVSSLSDSSKTLDALKSALVDAASLSTGLWVSYLFVLFYLTITTSGVTHRDLFLENPVKLPFFGVDLLPLTGFFVIAPAVFLVVHAYILLHLVLLANKVGAFQRELTEITRNTIANEEDLRRQLPNNIFIQFIAGPLEVRTGVIGFMLRLVARLTVVVAPILLLIFFELQFLAFHEWKITLWHRIALIIDLLLLWMLWPSVENGTTTWFRVRSLRRPTVVAAAVASVFSILVVLVLATYPGERLNSIPPFVFVPTKMPHSTTAIQSSSSPSPVCSLNSSSAENNVPLEADETSFSIVDWVRSMEWTSLYTLLIAGDVDPTKLRPTSLWPNSNRLVLPKMDIIDHTKFDSQEKIDAVINFAILRGRHLEGAVFCGADLRKVDFTGAWLDGAYFNDAKLQGAIFDNAEMLGAKFNRASLQGASLAGRGTQLQKSEFTSAALEGAELVNAHLEGANFVQAGVRAASFQNSHLDGAFFNSGYAVAASFDNARLSGAHFPVADLRGATIGGAHLDGADLMLVGVWRVDIRGPQKVTHDGATISPCWIPFVADATQSGTRADDSFEALKKLITDTVPKGGRQNRALSRIERVNPHINFDDEKEMRNAWFSLVGQGDVPIVNPADKDACK